MVNETTDRERIAKLAKQSTSLVAVIACTACGMFSLFLPMFRGTGGEALPPAVGVLVVSTSYMLMERRLRIEPLLREVSSLRTELARLGDHGGKDV